jgi:hypothetical protein
MLMKMTTGVNVINILQALFSYEGALRSFSIITVLLGIFLAKYISKKAACKIFMTITTVYLIYFHFRKFNKIKNI